MSCYRCMLGCLVIVACLYAFGLALVLPHSVPRQLLGQRSLMRGSGNACNSARQRKNREDDCSSITSSKISSPSLLMASMFGKVVPPKPAQFKKVSPKLQTAKLLPQKSPMSFLDQIKQRLSSDKKVAGAVSSGVQKVAKQNQKLVRRSVDKMSPTKTKAAASQLIQQAQRRTFLTKVGLTVAVLYVVWTFGVKELLRNWERKELQVWVDALDNLDYYEVRRDNTIVEDNNEPSTADREQECWWNNPLPSDVSTQLFAPNMSTATQRSLGSGQSIGIFSALKAAWRRTIINAQRPTDLAQALQGSPFRAQLAEALLDAAPVGTFPGEVVSVISDALIESDVPHLPQPGGVQQVQQLLAAVRVEWLQAPPPAESFARVVNALVMVLVDKAVETVLEGRQTEETVAALMDLMDLIQHAEILYTRLIPAQIELLFLQYHGAAKRSHLEQVYGRFLAEKYEESAGTSDSYALLDKLQVILRITDARQRVLEEQLSLAVDDPYAPNASEIGADPSENVTEDDKLLSQIAPKFEPEYSAELDKPAEEGAGATVWTPKTDTGTDTDTQKEEEPVQHSRIVESDDKSEGHSKVAKVAPERAVVAEASSPPDMVRVAPATIDEESKEVEVMKETEVVDDDIFGDDSSDSSRFVGNESAQVSSPPIEDRPALEPVTVSVLADGSNISVISDVLPVTVVDDFNVAATTGVVTHEAPLPSSERVTPTSPIEDGIARVAVDAQAEDDATVNVTSAMQVSEGLDTDSSELNSITSATDVSVPQPSQEVSSTADPDSAAQVESSTATSDHVHTAAEVEVGTLGLKSEIGELQTQETVTEVQVEPVVSVAVVEGNVEETVKEVEEGNAEILSSTVNSVEVVESGRVDTESSATEENANATMADEADIAGSIPVASEAPATPASDTAAPSCDLFDNPFDDIVSSRPASLTQALQGSTFRVLVAQALIERIPHGTFPLETTTTIYDALLQAEVDQVDALTGPELLKQIQQAVEKEELTPVQTAEGLAQVATALAVLLVDRALPTLAHISHTSTIDALDVLTDFISRAGNLYMSLVPDEVTVAPIEYTGGASLSRLDDLYYRYTKAAVAASVKSQPSKVVGENAQMPPQYAVKLQQLQIVLKVSRQRKVKVEQRVISEHKAAMASQSAVSSDNTRSDKTGTQSSPQHQHSTPSTSSSVQRNHAHKPGTPPHSKLGGGSGSTGTSNAKNVPQTKWGAGVGFGAPKKPLSKPTVHDDEAGAGEEVKGQKKMASTGTGPTLTNEQRSQLENMNPEFFEQIQVRLATGRIDLREVLVLEKTLGFTVNSAVRSLELAPDTRLRKLHSALGQSHGDVIDIFRKLAALKEGK